MEDMPPKEPEAPPAADGTSTNGAFVDEGAFTPPEGSQERIDPSAAEPKRGPGRPAMSDEEKEMRAKERTERSRMGDLFGAAEEEPPRGDDGEPAARGTTEHIPRKKPARRPDLEAMAEIICLNQYVIMGLLFDPSEAHPLACDPATKLPIHPAGVETHTRLKMAWTEYLRSKDVTGASPGLILLGVNFAYAAGVITQPKSMTRWKKYCDASIGWIVRLFSGKSKKT